MLKRPTLMIAFQILSEIILSPSFRTRHCIADFHAESKRVEVSASKTRWIWAATVNSIAPKKNCKRKHDALSHHGALCPPSKRLWSPRKETVSCACGEFTLTGDDRVLRHRGSPTPSQRPGPPRSREDAFPVFRVYAFLEAITLRKSLDCATGIILTKEVSLFPECAASRHARAMFRWVGLRPRVSSERFLPSLRWVELR